MKSQARTTNPAGVWLALGMVVLIVAGLSAVAAMSHLRSTQGAAPGTLLAPQRISTAAAAGLTCPSSAFFSPDGAQLAVIGLLGPCQSESGGAIGTSTHAVVIFDARTGALLKVVRLEPLLDLNTASGPVWMRANAVAYLGLGWSPDGDHLAIAFTAFNSSVRRTLEHLIDSGLLLLDPRHGTADVIHGDAGYFTRLGSETTGFPIWNVAQHIETPGTAIAPGLTFSWGHNSVPAPLAPLTGPVTQLPIDAGPRYPVGNPDGGATFTIWQPGLVVGPARTSLGAGHAVFLSAFPTWSPDNGAVTFMTAGAALPLPPDAAPSATSAAGGPLPLPTPAAVAQTPARDAALDAVQREIGTSGWGLVAWNPAGSLLASVNCNQSAGQTVTIRATATGQEISSAPLNAQNAGCSTLLTGGGATGGYPNTPLSLLWSPDGDTLLVCDRTAGTLSLWPVTDGTLPAAH
jgi:WD40 repeat protein